MPSPNLADFDSDGDLDLLRGEFLDAFTYFENVDSRSSPRFAVGCRLVRDGCPIAMDLQMIMPTAVDWDRDGDPDLIVGDEDERVVFVENLETIAESMPGFTKPRYFRQVADSVKFGALVTRTAWTGTRTSWQATPQATSDSSRTSAASHHGSSHPCGFGWKGRRFAFKRAPTAPSRDRARPSGDTQRSASPTGTETVFMTSSPTRSVDGSSGIAISAAGANRAWTRRAVQVDWKGQPRKPAWNSWTPGPSEMVSQWRTRLVTVDWNRDGLVDLVMLDQDGYLAWFERAQSAERRFRLPGKRIFEAQPNSAFDRRHKALNQMPGLLRLKAGRAGRSGRRKIDLADWDGDGLLDILVNSTSVDWLRNRGSWAGRVLLRDEGPHIREKLAGHTTSPTTVDWNGDGRRELLVGTEDGFRYWLDARGPQ